MPTPDVRVRLSAEGTAEVVAALRKVQAESAATKRASEKSFGGMGGAVGKLKNLLVGLGTYLSARAFVGFIRGSVATVGAMNETAQAVGTTTENLSTMQYAARGAGVEIGQLNTLLPTLARNLEQARDGSGPMAAALRRLEQVSPGLRKALAGTDDSIEKLAILSAAFAKVPDGATKSALAMQIFGRAGKVVVPLVNELGAKGLPTMRKEAEAAGQVVGTELSQAVDAAADQMTALKTQAQILGAQFFLGLAPELRRSLGMISGDLKDSGKDWREYGRQVGEVLPGLVLVFGTAFDFIASGIRRLGQRIAGLAIQTVSAVRVMNLEATGQSARAEAEREIARKVVEEIGAQMEAEEKARLERMNRRSAEAARLRGQLRGESGEAGWHPPMARPPERADLRGLEVDSQQILALQKASIDNEISLLKAKNQLRNEEEKQAFAEGLQNVREFYADRRRILEEAVAAEIAALLQKKVLLVGEENESKRKKESAAIDAQIAQLSIEAATERLQLAGEEKKEIQSLGEDRLALEKRLLELQGNRHAAAMLDIEAEIRKVSEDLTAAGDPKREALVASLRRMLESKEAFEETLRQADAAMADLELARGQIQAKVEAGLMSELDGERALLLVEQDRMKALRDIAEKLMAAAAATGDPELVRQAEEFSNALIGVGVRVSDLDLQIQHLGQSIRGALTGELADFFSDGITQAANFGEAVKSLALSIVQSIRRIVSELIAAQIVKGLFGLFGGGGQVGGGKVLAAGGLIRKAPIRRFSAGGYLRGPGTGTSDSLVGITEGGRPARFSAGEFVTREAVVRQPGALDFLEAFNRAGMAAIRDVSPRVSAASLPRFAEGGLVRGGTAPGTSRGGHLKISLDRGLIMETLESPEGQRVLVQSAYRNRRAMQAAQRE